MALHLASNDITNFKNVLRFLHFLTFFVFDQMQPKVTTSPKITQKYIGNLKWKWIGNRFRTITLCRGLGMILDKFNFDYFYLMSKPETTSWASNLTIWFYQLKRVDLKLKVVNRQQLTIIVFAQWVSYTAFKLDTVQWTGPAADHLSTINYELKVAISGTN